MALLEVKDLELNFKVYKGSVQAIRGVSFEIEKGKTMALVGESGSGKSVTSKAIMQLLPKANSEITNGQILFDGRDLLELTEKEMRHVRGKDIAMIFQNPMTSLNPVIKIGKQIEESMKIHNTVEKSERKNKTLNLLKLVGIFDPEVTYNQYPHQLSGGMRQRIVIAIALACEAKLLIADEPTTALDVTIQSQILELLEELKLKKHLTMLFITHDLGVVARVADSVSVMYAGKIVEKGTVNEVFYNPQHPYTWGLLSSIPNLDDLDSKLISIPGTPPNLMNPPQGDAFAIRSDYALDIDFEEAPPMMQVPGSTTHFVATWLLDERTPEFAIPQNIKSRHERWAKIKEELNDE